jgi:hypothetical protein
VDFTITAAGSRTGRRRRWNAATGIFLRTGEVSSAHACVVSLSIPQNEISRVTPSRINRHATEFVLNSHWDGTGGGGARKVTEPTNVLRKFTLCRRARSGRSRSMHERREALEEVGHARNNCRRRKVRNLKIDGLSPAISGFPPVRRFTHASWPAPRWSPARRFRFRRLSARTPKSGISRFC